MSELAQTYVSLANLARELAPAVNKLRELDETRVQAEADFKSAFARAFREASGSVEDRKQQAWLEADKLWRIWSLAESAVKMQQAHIKALHARVDVGRSIFSAQRAEMAFVSAGGGS
jgi:outer membrane protein TolC